MNSTSTGSRVPGGGGGGGGAVNIDYIYVHCLQWNLSNPDRRKCPDFRGCKAHKRGIWGNKKCQNIVGEVS